ncbi:dipeptide ABC transporter permease DppC, partial [Bacillus pumilus]
MADIQNTVPQSVTPRSGRALALREFWGNFSRNRGAVAAGVIVLVLAIVALFAPLIA